MVEILADKEIAAVICTYNRYDLLPQAIDSLVNQTIAASKFHIIIVDNTPENEQQIAFRDKYHKLPNIHYHIEPIAGLSNARNVGAKIGNSKYTAYLDDDAVASEAWLENIVAAFQAFPKAGVVGGQILPIWPVARPAWLPDSALGALSVVDWEGELRKIADNEWVAGANFSVLTEALLEVEGFNTALGRKGGGHVLLSNEEAHLREKIELRGYITLYAPEASVDHLVDERRLNRAWLRRRMAWQAISQVVQDDQLDEEAMERAWDDMQSVFSHFPPHLRSVRGFFHTFAEPELNSKQIGAFYSLTMLLLGGYEIDGV